MNYNVGATFSGKPNRKIHPWLMVCFVIGWGLLGALVVLQDHAIDAQKELINLLLQDLHTGLTTPIGHHTGTSVPVVMKPGAAAQVPSNQLPSQQVQSQSTRQSRFRHSRFQQSRRPRFHRKAKDYHAPRHPRKKQWARILAGPHGRQLNRFP